MPGDGTSPPARWLIAEQATAELGVSRPTLYAYVSRHQIGAVIAPDDLRRSLYDAADVRRLAQRKRSGRSRRAVAASTINSATAFLQTLHLPPSASGAPSDGSPMRWSSGATAH